MKRLAAILLVISQLATASEISVHWHDLPGMVTGKDIIVDTAAGDHIRGVALAVRADVAGTEIAATPSCCKLAGEAANLSPGET